MNFSQTTHITLEQPEHATCVDELSEIAFGPGRFTRTAFKIREGIPHEPELSFVLYYNGKIVGSVRLTRIKIGDDPSLLLGPLVVSPEYKYMGFGKQLMEHAVVESRAKGHGSILLVGDAPYYQRFGFEQVPRGDMTLPGPVDYDRLLICYLQEGENKLHGSVRG